MPYQTMKFCYIIMFALILFSIISCSMFAYLSLNAGKNPIENSQTYVAWTIQQNK